VDSFGKVSHYKHTVDYGFDHFANDGFHEHAAITNAVAWLKNRKRDGAKPLCGLVPAAPVEAAKPAAPVPPPRPGPPPPALAPSVIPNVTTHTGVFKEISKGDERRSLQVLCTKVKQEAESLGGAPGETEIDRLYRAALADIDRGRSLDAVRDLVRSLEGFLARRRGAETARTFHDRMAPLL
ncbi:MAG TPA: hypothetical protein PK598_16710, partial [Thermoanaerobaculia bacterium]|nr:hypothetical protein [Thermoanaerobaculia bacterium]